MLKDSNAFSTFAVDDTDKAKEFYRQTLGLEFTEEMGVLNFKLTGGTKLMIYPKADHKPAVFTVLNFPVTNLDEVVDQLTAKGVKFEQYDNEMIKTDEKGIADNEEGPRMAWFTDPSGNILSVLEE